MKFRKGQKPQIAVINRLMEMLLYAEKTGRVALVPFIEQAIREVAVELKG